jgi:hypothetical protein
MPKAPLTPQQAAQQVLKVAGRSTRVTTEANVTVAGQAAYQLVLAPKPSGSQLAKIPIAKWVDYTFWAPANGKLEGVTIPNDLLGYDTYTSKGLMPGPICTPSLASIDAALNPDTKDHYLFFLAKHDGTDTTAFAKTQAEHEANIRKYGQ